MCRECGCDDPERSAQATVRHFHDHEHSPGPRSEDHHHHHDHGHEREEAQRRTLAVKRSLMELNDHLAQHNRIRFALDGVLVLNLMSSPGAGKTRLLELTLRDLADRLRMGVVVGDLETDNDARRLRQAGGPIISINTGTLCHLDADMVARAAEQLDLEKLDVLFVENVGNLVCPASFDLGEDLRVVLMSSTEGEDKPLKYPPAFKRADVVVLTKTDLANPNWCDLDVARENIRMVAPQAELIELSARTGEGLDAWYRFLLAHARKEAAPAPVGILDGAEI